MEGTGRYKRMEDTGRSKGRNGCKWIFRSIYKDGWKVARYIKSIKETWINKKRTRVMMDKDSKDG